MKLIHLTLTKNLRHTNECSGIYINPDYIIGIYTSDEHTFVTLSNDKTITVLESDQSIINLIEGY